MTIRVALTHRTTYDYERPISLSPQVVRLRPTAHNRTPIHSYSLRIEPKDHFLNWLLDPHGNQVARIVVPEKTPKFHITVDLVADLHAYNPFDFFVEPSAEHYPFEYSPELRAELAPYLERGPMTPKLAEFIEGLNRGKRGIVDFLVEMNQRTCDAVEYIVRMEPGVRTPEETLTIGDGSCRDSAWLLVQTLRNLGLAARFVSGYLIQLVADEKPVTGPEGPSADFCDLHAWCECFVPGAGWIGLDPTSGLFAAEGHIPLASAAHPASAAPLEGMTEKAETEFGFAMSVARVQERPRVTKPYTEQQWQSILSLGNQVDERLQAGDARLTTGGEPTFVSSQYPDAPEWNTAALGDTKLHAADRLLGRLYKMWAPNGFLHHGQGKWYPGEQLPRWAFACYFLKDGAPLWKNQELIARSDRDYGHTAEDAERFAHVLIRNLALTQHGLAPAYEDVYYYLWRERRLPVNVDVLESHLTDPLERERLRRVFQHGLGKKVGWLLPLAHDGGWQSGPWFLRDEHCFLQPGDSPMGFRLPLDSLPYTPQADTPFVVDRDPFEERPKTWQLPAFPLDPAHPARGTRISWQGSSRDDGGRSGPRQSGRSGLGPSDVRFGAWDSTVELGPGSLTRTALCLEPRSGILHIFMPPLRTLEQYLELVAAIEATASELSMPVQLEGYPPPNDPRLHVFKLTPDPGVLEVNVPPVESFAELVEQTTALYEAARQEHLVAEKFELDGTHVASGGGYHTVLGGSTPADSPFLRRPEVLGSLVSFWHNHPSLSYLFTGRFFGPTSQAPRIDEARNDTVYEVDMALRQLPGRNDYHAPWVVDRVLRNLLVDVTGNTHRAEFCIDKLYSPDGPTGRLGLVEMRAFEMPPHARMAVAMQLLVHALFARFWEEPYRVPLAQWNTALHDRFLLPFFVWQDFVDVLHDLRQRGYDFAPEWFTPHHDFRFPLCGKFVKDAVEVEIRGALEPWPVLGEEASAGGQTRYVDSSLERVQVLVRGMTEGRHLLCCNGVQLPLHPTGVVGEYVCGVRYRAWQPTSCLQPLIGVHSPLRFDLYDDWNQRTIAGATYHVVHPGGRAHDTRPVNAMAAEGRRISRFETSGHTPGPYVPTRIEINSLFPLTLDLRHISLPPRSARSLFVP